MLEQKVKQNSKECWSKNATLLKPAADVERLSTVTVECYGVLHIGVKGLYEDKELGRTADFWQKEERPISDDEVERLGEINKADVKEKLLLPAFLLKLT